MTRTTQTVLVAAPDGTKIADVVSGEGRPLVLVHGSTSDHTTWRLVRPLLEPHFAVHAVDRRGRGGSGDSPDYSVALEFADIAAVIDATAEATGLPVDVLGHSYGGNVAFGAAALTTNIRKLVLYEGWPPPDLAHRTTAPDTMRRLESLLAQGRPEALLDAFYRELAHVPADEISALKADPTWPARVAAAHTVPRELRAFGEHAFDPRRAAQLAMPVLLIVGADSVDEIKADPERVAAALPDARIRVLDGQGHLAQLTAPEAFAELVASFLAG